MTSRTTVLVLTNLEVVSLNSRCLAECWITNPSARTRSSNWAYVRNNLASLARRIVVFFGRLNEHRAPVFE